MTWPSGRHTLFALAACMLASALPAPPAAAQSSAAAATTVSPGDERVVDGSPMVDPGNAGIQGTEPPIDEGGGTGGAGGTDGTGGTSGTTDDTGTPRPEAARRDRGYGNAALQSRPAKQAEAEADCVTNRPPISRMLGVGGTVTGPREGSWTLLAVVVGIAAALVAAVPFVIRHARGRRGRGVAPRGLLETVGAVVAISAGIAGLAAMFIPGVGVEDRPARSATMTVREVHARITRGEYAAKTNYVDPATLQRDDRREVGNVVWLEIGLTGFRSGRPELQFGLYDPDANGALLRGTAKQVKLRVKDEDVQTLLLPVWVGYPRSRKFQAQFRLIEGEEVRQMTATGPMRSSEYRYGCTTTS